MKSNKIRRWESVRGQALVETALVLPLLIAFSTMVMDVGYATFNLNTMNHVAREAARDLAVDPRFSPQFQVPDGQDITVVRQNIIQQLETHYNQQLAGLMGASMGARISIRVPGVNDSGNVADNPIRVNVQADHPLFTTRILPDSYSTIPLTAKSTAFLESAKMSTVDPALLALPDPDIDGDGVNNSDDTDVDGDGCLCTAGQCGDSCIDSDTNGHCDTCVDDTDIAPYDPTIHDVPCAEDANSRHCTTDDLCRLYNNCTEAQRCLLLGECTALERCQIYHTDCSQSQLCEFFNEGCTQAQACSLYHTGCTQAQECQLFNQGCTCSNGQQYCNQLQLCTTYNIGCTAAQACQYYGQGCTQAERCQNYNVGCTCANGAQYCSQLQRCTTYHTGCTQSQLCQYFQEGCTAVQACSADGIGCTREDRCRLYARGSWCTQPVRCEQFHLGCNQTQLCQYFHEGCTQKQECSLYHNGCTQAQECRYFNSGCTQEQTCAIYHTGCTCQQDITACQTNDERCFYHPGARGCRHER